MPADSHLGEDEYVLLRPPVWILVIAIAVVAVAFTLTFRSDLVLNVTGYALGSIVCVGAVALFVKVDSVRRNAADVVYLESVVVRYVWSTVLLAGIATCGVHAWKIAEELAARS